MSDAQKVDAFIHDFPDWRGKQLAYYRRLVHEVCPEIKEEYKWGVPIFTLNKMILGISAFKNHVKINFLQGAQLADPDHLFNSGLDSKLHRSIDTKEGESVDESALRRLIQSAIDLDITLA